MSIESNDITWRKSIEISNVPQSNGGRMSAVESVTNVRGASFPDVPQSERLAGSVTKRKFFVKVSTDPSIEMLNSQLYLDAVSPGQDYLLLQYTGSQTDTEDQIPGGQRYYGIGTIKTNVAQGVTQIVVTMEHANMGDASQRPFKPGDTLWVTNKVNKVAVSGEEEFLTIGPDVGDVTWSGADATINLVAATTLAWNAGDRVASVINVGSVVAGFSAFTVTSTSGTYTSAANLVLNGYGAIQQNWTITITDAGTGAFRLDGDTLGSSVATGNMSTDFLPNNADFTKPYLELKMAGWGGTWATNDTITFTTTPAAIPYWEVRFVPAGAASIASTGIRIAISGESAT